LACVLSVTLAGFAGSASADPASLLFHAPGDGTFDAATSHGSAAPLFRDKVQIVPTGAIGGAIQADHDQILAWPAAGNLYAQRGTLAFFWRSREPVGRQAFPIFRVGYPEHTSWDMVFLRIDWNGHGYDAFVTDTNLARTRVSFRLPKPPAADAWTHLAFAWDETDGVRLYVDGQPVARRQRPDAVYDASLFAFGPHSRVIAGYQVQSAYNFQRGGDIDEIRIYDRMLAAGDVARLAQRQAVDLAGAPPRTLADPTARAAWWRRYGFDRPSEPPPYLENPVTHIRKVEFTDARDLKARDWKGSDGIRETTWPGVYNRSRLPGRHDYFELPDWNVYSVGGKRLEAMLPAEAWNRVEVTGAAHGALSLVGAEGEARTLGRRAKGVVRSTLQLPSPAQGGTLRFDNVVQETPIQEIAVYNVAAGVEPSGVPTLSYTVDASAEPGYRTLDELNAWIRGRHPADERDTVVALPAGAPRHDRATPGRGLPLAHVLIPADFRDVRPDEGPSARFSYGWANLNGGLDGIALDIPALKVRPTHGGLVPLNIRVKDPIWPDRDLLDVNVSVKPGEARTVWLDTRDRILPNDRSLYLAVAGAAEDFDASSLNGMRVRLVFKDRKAAVVEHVADRFEQVRGNLAFFVEEQPNNRLLPVYERFDRDVTDLLRVDPDHKLGRIYWNEQNNEQPYPTFTQASPPAGVPLWAFRQAEDLKLVERFVHWWIDQRQIENGEFGGGLSDDTDLVNQWPPLALMGAEPEKITDSHDRMVEAVYANGMITDGLNTIPADELHSYEEGVNAIAQGFTLHWGDPLAIERAMATARHYQKLTEVNPAGHRHFVSNLFSATDRVREGVWQWQKTPNFLILHPGLLLAQYNGDPTIKRLFIEMADGYLAHGVPAPGGGVILPAQVYWPTDEAKSGPGVGNGAGAVAGLFWAAYRWTGDEKYLGPLKASGIAGLTTLGPDALSVLGQVEARSPEMIRLANQADTYQLSNTGGGGSSTAFARHAAWQATGDKRYLEAVYAREIQSASQRMFMMTEGHLWSDRVQIPSEMLQRARLGGVAFRRGQIFPGNVISWRFAAPAKATDIAILTPVATQARFKVIAFNLSDRPVEATLTGWDVTAGRWRVTEGLDSDGDDLAEAPQSRTISFERTTPVPVRLEPKRTTVLEFALEEADSNAGRRPDVGIGRGDVRRERGGYAVTVHSLGAIDAPAGTITLEDSAGKVLATARAPALRAPADLLPKTATVRLSPAREALLEGARIRVRLDGDPAEITTINNVADLP
jgi:hypothetical protein